MTTGVLDARNSFNQERLEELSGVRAPARPVGRAHEMDNTALAVIFGAHKPGRKRRT
jgi:hypothetical protein